MKRVRVTGRPNPSVAPPAFRLIADSDSVDEARLHDWTVTGDRITALYTVDGDREGFAAALESFEEVVAADTDRIDDDRFSLLLTLDPATVPLFRRMFDALLREGVVVVKPAVYRDGRVHATLVGDAETLRAMLDDVPAAVDVAVHEVGRYRGDPTTAPAAALTDRQRDALLTALELGYYDRPASATHEDVADHLDCAPSTASEHLKKGETTLVREVFRRE